MDGPLDPNESPAIMAVNSLVERGKISPEKGEQLRQNYLNLQNKINQIYTNDEFLLHRGDVLKNELKIEKQKVKECEKASKEDEHAIDQLMQTLAVSEIDLAVAQDRDSKIQSETLELENKNKSLRENVSNIRP